MAKRIIPVLIILAISALVWAWWPGLRAREEDRGRIFISGNIEATEVDLAFRIGGEIARFPVEEGDRLRAGEEVARLDTDTLEALKGAAEAAVAQARAILDELETGTRKEEIEMARARLKAADSRLRNAKSEYRRQVGLFKGGSISASRMDEVETTLKVALAEKEAAEERLKELELGPREEKIRAARARLKRAQWELKKIELDLEHSVVRSPINGPLIVKANERGEVVLPGATIATVAKTDEVWLKGYVSERSLGKVKLGQPVEVTTDSFPGKIYRGRVSFISPRAEFTPKNVQTREERVKQVYRVKVTLPNPLGELKIGMPAEGYIIVDGSGTRKQRKSSTKGHLSHAVPAFISAFRTSGFLPAPGPVRGRLTGVPGCGTNEFSWSGEVRDPGCGRVDDAASGLEPVRSGRSATHPPNPDSSQRHGTAEGGPNGTADPSSTPS